MSYSECFQFAGVEPILNDQALGKMMTTTMIKKMLTAYDIDKLSIIADQGIDAADQQYIQQILLMVLLPIKAGKSIKFCSVAKPYPCEKQHASLYAAYR